MKTEEQNDRKKAGDAPAKADEPASLRKGLVSGLGLLLALLAVIYAAPHLQEKMKEWGKAGEEKESAANPDKASAENVESAVEDVPTQLSAWLPLVRAQLPVAGEGGKPPFRIVHMRLNNGKDKLLLDLEGPEGRIDLVLVRDEFGRFVSTNESLPLKIYPPEQEESR